ncbi:MAG: FAD binding domain-containing protein [Gammaproteobacteria bacterium]
MKPPPFRYVRAQALEGALSVLASEGDEAKLLAGGQSLIAMMNLRLVKPQTLVDINGLSELDYIRTDNGKLSVGAMTRLAAAERSPELAQACPLMTEALRYVAHKPIRNRGTVGGNLAHADPSSELPAVALALDAEFVVRNNGSERRVAADDFFVSALTTSMAPEEALTAVEFPGWPGGRGWSFMEISPRKGDYALVGVAVTLAVENDRCGACRVVYTGNGDRARRIPEVESAVAGRAADDDTFQEAGRLASSHIEANSDLHASEQYRRDLAGALTQRALASAAARCRQEV